MSDALISLQDVDKSYGSLRALRSVTLDLPAGRIGLLGPNGAGKSTLLKTLLGLLRPERGKVEVLGHSLPREAAKVRAHVGYMPEGDAVVPNLTAVEYTTMAAELCGLPRAEATTRAHQVLYYVGLGEARYRKLGSYSAGMRQRARLAQALVGDPELLLLDEPTSGLDPRGRDEMLALLGDIAERTRASVVVSTHILPDVEKTCDQVVLIAEGQVRFAGALNQLIGEQAGLFEVRIKGAPQALEAPLVAAGCQVTCRPTALDVRVPEGQGPKLILRIAVGAGLQVRHLAPLKRTLEDAFARTVGTQQTASAQGVEGPQANA